MYEVGFRDGGIPDWIKGIKSAVWVTDSLGEICYLNEKAEELLERPASDCIGRPCDRVVCNLAASGDSFCDQVCPTLTRTQGVGKTDSVPMHIAGTHGTNRWVRVLIIAIEANDLPDRWLVHCALNDNRAHRMEEYLDKIYSRTPKKHPVMANASHPPLTKREQEILQHLSNDETLQGIANSLHLSYATVRNHVHHILNKLGVHSIMEAIASYLLVKED